MNMTDEEIIAAADACGLMLFGLGMDKAKFEFCILAFAKFVGKIERFKEREVCAKLAKEYAAEYKEGGRLYPMLNGSVTKAVASACDHTVYIIGERGKHD